MLIMLNFILQRKYGKEFIKTGLLFLCSILVNHVSAQITVTNTNIANTLAQKLSGPGVKVTNATMQCQANQSGLFVVTASNIGIDSGIVLTTGVASSNFPVYGVNGLEANLANTNQGTIGDPDLTTLAGTATYDRCILEFDFKANGDSIFFKYVFGSEEYPAYNCTAYNDVFGFFISGPGFAVPQNLALVPNTNIPVAINSVNSGVISSGGNIANCTAMGAGSPFTSLYVNNTGGSSVTYSGFTQVFTSKTSILPCSTYHLKLAIADGFDHILDSGVFLKAGSLTSNTVLLSVTADSMASPYPYVYEGCDSAVIKIHRKIYQTNVTADTVNLVISGTATNGVDYPILQTTYPFTNSVNDTLRTLYLVPINDLITEGTETVKILIYDNCSTPSDSIMIGIKDPPTLNVTNADSTMCLGGSMSINGTFGTGLNFSWSPSAGVSNTGIFNTLLTPTATTTYTVTGTYGSCAPVKDSVTLTVLPLPTISTSGVNVTCFGQNNGSITATGTGTPAPLTFQINPGGSVITGSPATFSNLVAGVYTITVTNGAGCTKTSVKTITQPTLVSWNTTTSANIPCNAVNTGQITSTATGGTGAISYNLMPGNVNNSSGVYSGLGVGIYTVTAKDANNCSITTTFTIVQSAGLIWNSVTHTNPACFGNTTNNITASASGGTGIITYTLMPGSVVNTTGIYNGLGAGTYTVTSSSANGCTASTTVTITTPPILSFAGASQTNILCFGGSNGTITAPASGGTGTKTYGIVPGGVTNTTGSFIGLSAQTYTITVTDANGCTKTTSLTITQNPDITITNVAKTNPSCIPGNNGSITVTASGGVPSLTYKLNAGTFQASSTFSGLTIGTYTITVKDANGCTKTTTASLIFPNAPTLANNTLALTCTNTITTISVTASGGTAPYTYTLLPNNTSNSTGNFPGMGVGTYTVNVVDANGCPASIIVPLVIPPTLFWGTFIKNNLPCTGPGLGSVSATVTGGTPPISFNLMPGNLNNTTGNYTGLAANTYTITATDAIGCTVTSAFTISATSNITFTAPNVTNVVCNGQNNGNISISASGGGGTLSYSIAPGGTSNTTGAFSNLTAGTYTITASNGQGCTHTTTVVVAQPPSLVINSLGIVSPNCPPGPLGSITVNASGGTPGYTYKYNSAPYQASNYFGNMPIGWYQITVKDANNCTKSSVVILTVANAPSFTSVTSNQVNCSGGSNATITAVVTGGTGAITYSINPGGTVNSTGVFSGLTVNTYTITATDGTGCSVSTTASIIQPTSITWSSTFYSNVLCNNAANGSIIVSAAGGNGGYTYTAQPGNLNSGSGTFTGLAPNVYTVTASDVNGCSATTTFNVTQPSPLVWNSFTSTPVLCTSAINGTINASATGGTPGYNYSLQPVGFTNTTGSFTNLGPATYTLTATDAYNCSVSSVVTIIHPPVLTITNVSSTVPTCVPGNNATINISVTGGAPSYLYNLNGGSNQSSSLFTGIGVSVYTVNVKDANNCTLSTVVNISNPAAPNVNSVSTTPILCYGNINGSITASASGGSGALSYTLNPIGITNSTGIFNTLGANNYTVVVSDAGGCTATTNVLLNQPPVLMWDSVNKRDVSCFGGSNGIVTSSASGGTGVISYNLNPGNITNISGAFFGLSIGNYTLVATDSNGCTVSATFLISQFPPITWNSVSSIPTSCFGGNNGTIIVQASGGNGGFEYLIQPGGQVNTSGFFNNLTPGSYTISATDANTCTETTVVNVGQATPVTLGNVVTTFASCNPGCDGSVVVTGAGGNGAYTYSLNGTNFQLSTSFVALCSASYTVTIKDGNNCTGTGIFNITTANGPSQLNTNVTNVTCSGGNNGNISATTIGGSGAISYYLQPLNLTNTTGLFTGLTANTYTITATDANGCTISTTAIVGLPLPLTGSISNITNVTCFGGANGTITAVATGGTPTYQYTINPFNLTNTTGICTGLPANTYTITITDANGCTSTTVATVTVPPAIQFAPPVVQSVSCNAGNNGVVNITATGGTGSMNYTIQPLGASSTTGIFNGLTAFTYTVTATDVNGCTNTTTVTVTQPPVLAVGTVTNTIPTCAPGNDAQITMSGTGGTPTYSYAINNGTYQSGNTFTSIGVGTYTLTVMDANGCTASSVYTVNPPPPPSVNSVTTTFASCNPGCDGTATITASGGLPGYTYSSNNGLNFQGSSTFSALCAGTYTVVVKDARICTATSIVNITTSNGPSQLVTNVTNATCYNTANGSITATTIGGTGTITYVLQPGAVTNTTGIYNNLAFNTYTITATDVNGCTISSITSITEPSAITASVSNVVNVSCNGGANGSFNVSAAGGTASYTYLCNPGAISNTTGIFNGLTMNMYTVTITDANNCSMTTTANVTQPAVLQFTTPVLQQVSCNGGSDGAITISTTGGSGTITYALQPSSTSNTTGIFTSLPAVTYTITATDANNCSVTTQVTLTQPGFIMITSITGAFPSCVPGGDGVINITAIGGVPALTYSVNGTTFQASSTFNTLSVGTYTVTVKDANNCTISSLVFVNQPPSPSVASVVTGFATCNPGCDGTMTVSGSGGLPGYTYSVNGTTFQASANFTGLCAGTYTVTVKDARNCTGTSVFNITTSNGPNQINAAVTNVSCNGGNNGSITATTVGGNGIITYLLQPGGTSNTSGIFNNLVFNNYTVTATDVNGCTITTIASVNQPAPLTSSFSNVANVSCNGGANGSFIITASGGTSSYSFTVNPGNLTNTTGVFSGLSALTYTAVITDANGCTLSTSTTITQPPLLQFASPSLQQVSCNGGADGTITISATGGTGGISYLLQPFGTTNTTGTFNNLPALTYTITATDANNCTATTQITLTQPSILFVSSLTGTIPTCVPGGDAVITAAGSGGTPVYSYSINGGAFQTSTTFNNISIGSYTITVKDANNCTASSVITISQPNSPVVVSVSTTQATCNPGCDGSITFTAAGGTGALTYSSGGAFQATGLFTAMCNNTYTVTAQDALGCTVTSAVIVTTVSVPTLINTANTNVFCNGGSNATITLTAAGGTLPVTYVLMPGSITNTTGAFTGLTSGTYTITGTDVNGCTLATNVTITQPATLLFTAAIPDSVQCFNGVNGSINFTVAGGTPPISYVINPAGTFSGPSSFIGLLGNVTYTITATDANGCTATTAVYVGQPTPVTITNTSSTPVTCAGQANGSINVTAVGGTGNMSYLLQPGAISNSTGAFTNLSGNTYTVTCSDANSCTVTTQIFIFEPTPVLITSASATDVICFGQNNGTITVTAAGGIAPLSYNLQPINQVGPNGSYTNLAPNTYTVIVTDANACTTSTAIVVNEPTLVQVSSLTGTDVKCFGESNGSVTALATGGIAPFNYLLQPVGAVNTNGVFLNLPIGTYTVLATDANGCTATSSITLTQPLPLDLTVTGNSNVTCASGNNGSITGVTTGGTLPYLYMLQPLGMGSSVGTYTAVPAGVYTLYVTDANGCADSVLPIPITQPPALVFSLVTHTDILCYQDSSGSITVGAYGGNGTLTYSLTPVSGNQVAPGYFANVGGGTYTVTVTDAVGCTLTTIVSVLENLQLSATVTFSEPTCHGDKNGSILITAIGGMAPMTYSLDGGQFILSGFFDNLGAGPHNVVINDAAGCTADTVLILLEPDPVGADVEIFPPACITKSDGKVLVTGTGGRADYTYYLKPGLYINKHGQFQNLPPAIYTLSVVDSSGCRFDSMVYVTPADPFFIAFNKKDLGCFGVGIEGWAEAIPTGGTMPYSYQWSTVPPQTDAKATGLRYGYYHVNVVDANGCEISDTVYIEGGLCCDEVFIPNAFSPNGDGKNDTWHVVTSTGLEIKQLEVYNRWGERVWVAYDITKEWDGTFRGKQEDMGTYYYIFRYLCLSDGQIHVKKGDVILVR
ncbi:MAG: choice-of-anchor L domain-containing protein [Chitinophagaceae bacterium]|nr:choice-of-anchor L domain-containing protein [Chitinophagaceae bacterium]